MALSGLLLIGFVIVHLLGNLTLYLPDGTKFNSYAAKLMSFGPLLVAAEAVLAGIFLLHVAVAIGLKIRNRAARPHAYHHALRTKGGETRSNLSSRHMIVTGMALLAFLVWHLIQFRLGPSTDAGYVAKAAGGEEVRDLHRLVVEVFQRPHNVLLYVAVMVFFGFHLRHGFWSAFQSLGAMNPRFTKPVYALGVAVAVALAAGFLFIPVWIYLDLPGGYR